MSVESQSSRAGRLSEPATQALVECGSRGLSIEETREVIGEEGVMIAHIGHIIGFLEMDGLRHWPEVVISYEDEIRLFGMPGLIRALEELKKHPFDDIHGSEGGPEIEQLCESEKALTDKLEEYARGWEISDAAAFAKVLKKDRVGLLGPVSPDGYRSVEDDPEYWPMLAISEAMGLIHLEIETEGLAASAEVILEHESEVRRFGMPSMTRVLEEIMRHPMRDGVSLAPELETLFDLNELRSRVQEYDKGFRERFSGDSSHP